LRHSAYTDEPAYVGWTRIDADARVHVSAEAVRRSPQCPARVIVRPSRRGALRSQPDALRGAFASGITTN